MRGVQIPPMPSWGRPKGPRPEPFDSSTRAVREVARALSLSLSGSGRGRGPLEAYPRGVGPFLSLVGRLPEPWRIALIEWGIARWVGTSPGRLTELGMDHLPRWCTAQYPPGKYRAIIVGSPSGAVAHLAALLRTPFLTSSFLLGFRLDEPLAPDDLRGYCRFGGELAERLAAANPGMEAILHYDPLHDRLLVKHVSFIRLRLVELPPAYEEFIAERLVEGGHLILAECTYPWPQYRLGERSYLQVGGLGGVQPGEFLKRWHLEPELPLEERPESEWGCPPGLAEGVRRLARERALKLIELRLDHPERFSELAYRAYLAAGAREDELMLDCFTYVSPLVNVTTGIPALWLPFNTRDSFEFARARLENRRLSKVYLALVPSYARCEDTVPFELWDELLRGRGELELLGVDPRAYPADPRAPFAFSAQVERLRRRRRLPEPLQLEAEDLERLARGLGLGISSQSR